MKELFNSLDVEVSIVSIHQSNLKHRVPPTLAAYSSCNKTIQAAINRAIPGYDTCINLKSNTMQLMRFYSLRLLLAPFYQFIGLSTYQSTTVYLNWKLNHTQASTAASGLYVYCAGECCSTLQPWRCSVSSHACASASVAHRTVKTLFTV